MTGPGPAHATFYRPAEVARMLRCSEWWVKEQARQRRIPFCWIGRSYLFTEEHIAAIVRVFEVRPVDVAAPKPTSGRVPPRRVGEEQESPTRLRARVPRRSRAAAIDSAA